MSRKKIIVYSISALILLSLLINGLFGHNFLSTKRCNASELMCERVIVDDKGRSIMITGTIIDKYIKDNIHYIKIELYSNKLKNTPVLFRLPPFPIKVMVNQQKSMEDKPIVLQKSAIETYNYLRKDEKISVFIPTPSKSEIEETKKMFPSTSYATCFQNHQTIAKYLSNPTFINKLIFELKSKISKCPINLLTIKTYR